MSWLVSIIVALFTMPLAAVCAGFVASKCVSWFGISSREGNAGYFIVFIGLLGAAAGLVAGLVVARTIGAPGAIGFLKTLGTAAASVVVMGSIALALCRISAPRKAQPAPRVDLVLEFRSPEQAPKPDANGVAELTVDALDLRSKQLLASNSGVVEWKSLRSEDGRWLLTGRVPLEHTAGTRIVKIAFNGKSQAFSLPENRDSSRELQWSEWLPRPRADGAAPVTPLTYRYKIEPAPR